MHPVSPSVHDPTYDTRPHQPIIAQGPQLDRAHALAAHHAQLVQYYWEYAQRGIVAPVVDNDEHQFRARQEALNWARKHGVELRAGATNESVSDAAAPEGCLPFTPGTSTEHSATNHGQRTLPAATPNIGHESSRRLLQQASISNPTAPSPRSLPSLASSSSSTQPSDSVQHGSILRRGLPKPPLQANQLRQAVSAQSSVPSSSIPTFVLSENWSNSEPPLVSIPSNDNETPSFSFSVEDEDATTASNSSIIMPKQPSSQPQPTSSMPRLHPRFDPSHPSHYLYHPSSSTPTHFTTSMITTKCGSCQFEILGRKLVAMGQEWHPECFKCMYEGCGQRLEHVEFDGKEGKVFCILHFEELFAETCYHCKTPIASDDIIQISDERLNEPTSRTYHALHFFCSSCGDPFVDPKRLGESAQQEGGGEGANPYMVHQGFAYCENCDLNLFRPKCASSRCGHSGIKDIFVQVGDDKYHEKCFRCSTCEKELKGTYLLDEENQIPLCLACSEE